MRFNVPSVEETAGQPLKTWRERICGYLRASRLIPGSGIKLTETPGGTIVESVGSRIRAAKADHGAIAPQTQGTVTLYTDITAANLTSPAVPLEVVNPMHLRTCPSGAPLVWILSVGSVHVILGWEC